MNENREVLVRKKERLASAYAPRAFPHSDLSLTKPYFGLVTRKLVFESKCKQLCGPLVRLDSLAAGTQFFREHGTS